jgi:hypothetical protein
MPVNHPVKFDVVVIFAEWVDQDFGNFEPSHIEAELERVKY